MSEPAENENDDTLWDATDVARYLKVSRSWVYHRAEAGLLPYLRVGGLLRFEPDAIRRHARGETTDIPRPTTLPVARRALGRSR